MAWLRRPAPYRILGGNEKGIMLDVKNPQIRVEEIMLRIQEKVRAKRPAASGVPAATVLSGSDVIDDVLERAQQVAQVGAALPGMSRQHGLKRVVAGGIAKAFLRIAQLITRDQRT